MPHAPSQVDSLEYAAVASKCGGQSVQMLGRCDLPALSQRARAFPCMQSEADLLHMEGLAGVKVGDDHGVLRGVFTLRVAIVWETGPLRCALGTFTVHCSTCPAWRLLRC